mmetsp:Transcript_2937/g.11844  ORF Transcript_2937/g.11844 Transcript_2937/m.11844 type:complete len:223 (+) Transcript_2937:2238-2906(+)
MASRVASRDLGTLSSAAVPVAPTPGGKPYTMRATRLSALRLRARPTQPLSLSASLSTRSCSSTMLSPESAPSATVSTAPSSSGSAYSTTLCRPATPERVQLHTSCTSSGAATTYGTFFAARMEPAISACRAPSMEPAGPPTSGKPMVDTMASTSTHSPSLRLSISLTPAARASASCGVVSRSRTTVCASTPLMKMGSGLRPLRSRPSSSCQMYPCRVMTCLR